jgi:dienelactone hydrolase
VRAARLLSILAAACLLANCAPGSDAPDLPDMPPAPASLRTDQVVAIQVTDAIGEVSALTTRICRPVGNGPFPVAIVNHPGAASTDLRRAMAPPGCNSPPSRFFLARGFIVAMPLRRGFGDSGDGWAANPGSCASPDYVQAAVEGGRDIDAVVRWVTGSHDARPDGIVVAGEDEGGWAALGYASVPNPRLSGVINVGGVMGTLAASEAGHICRPDLLIDAAGRLGATARGRTFWIYTAADTVVPLELAQRMAAAFVRSGGTADFAVPRGPDLDALRGDRHSLFFDPAAAPIWTPLLARFLGG